MPILNAHNADIYYEETGAGEAVVFLHGYTGSGKDWSNQVAVVSPKYRAITVDCRGHGKSSAPTSEEDYSIKISSEDVYALLSKLGIEKCCLVGHSMGGFMALQFAFDHPDRVTGLVLVDTSSGEFERTPGFAELRAKLDELAQNEGMEAAFEYDSANNPMRIERYKKHPEQRETAHRKMLQTSVDGYIYVARSFGTWEPVTSRLGEITVPTLIFWGDEDAPFQKPSETLRDSIPNAELVTVAGVGHSPHEEAPDIVNETLMKFLAGIEW
jgi:pimeloyl-ACP methyl ester carboxylesterase